MKSQRRHDLKANTLAQGIGSFPMFWHKHGTKVMVAVCAVLVIVLFTKYQMRAAAQKRQAAGEAYATALNSIANLQRLEMIDDPKVADEQRREIQAQANGAIDQVLENTKDNALKAEAMYARGELNWNLAMSQELTHASTRPTKGEQSSEELLDRAKQAYEAALSTAGARPLTVTTSRLALANIAEQRHQWDAAQAQYQQVINDPNAAAAMKEHAAMRRDDLKRLQSQPLLGKPATKPAPEKLGPAGPPMPTSGPTTQSHPGAQTVPAAKP